MKNTVCEVQVSNRLGLHARPAMMLVQEANRFASSIAIRKDRTTVDCRSILDLLTIAAPQGTTLQLIISGSDAEEAAAAITGIFDNKFGEE
ncbi:MAG: HPr family phosphocarrier protein [Lentisphaeria bacterium]|nr:HPr family phosphocarrier protein [Lentisphaeria bacterium]